MAPAQVVAASGTLLVANVGDSRAIVCCDANGEPVAATRDHVAADPDEAARIEGLGGRVEQGRVPRVEGKIAVTRSVGNRDLDPYLSAAPDVFVGDLAEQPTWRFLVVATDGLWDTMSSGEVSRFAEMKLAGRRGDDAFQAVATALTHEALVRQSSDNVAVVVVDLDAYRAAARF